MQVFSQAQRLPYQGRVLSVCKGQGCRRQLQRIYLINALAGTSLAQAGSCSGHRHGDYVFVMTAKRALSLA
jgi:hypothetical protein